MIRMKKRWKDWAKERFGYIPIRDFGSENEYMTEKQFEKSLRGQTINNKK